MITVSKKNPVFVSGFDDGGTHPKKKFMNNRK